MPGSGEGIVLVLIVIIVFVWIYYWMRNWAASIPRRRLPLLSEAAPMAPELAQLLEQAGYRGIGGKLRVPLIAIVDGTPLNSRLFIDGFAKKDGKLYVVRLARDRLPIEWTGPGVRDHFLHYALLYDQAEGLLYVDEREQSITEIRFEFPHPDGKED
jgi:hypothetical protein